MKTKMKEKLDRETSNHKYNAKKKRILRNVENI